ncbi:hypothetical protein ACRS3X_07670 [Ectopseudomonas hydrolytica]|uniref:hypothetical protein n=1 Tax=Ectopseudomonas hydrolytica TaxID=2493633 RepID=UPI003EE138A8
MSNVFDGYYVDVARDGDAVDICIYLLVDGDGFESECPVFRILFWVIDDSLEEISRKFYSEIGDYEDKLSDLAYKAWHTAEGSYTPHEEEDEDEDEDEDLNEIKEAKYVYSYDKRLYFKSPRIRRKVIDAILEREREGFYFF